MKIKAKLSILIGALLALILVLGLLASHYVYSLKNETGNILADNYNSVKYAREMQSALNRFIVDSSALSQFESSLEMQKRNITELDEQQATAKLEKQFMRLKADSSQFSVILVREAIDEIVMLNMASVYHKSGIARHTANEAMWWIVILSALSVAVALALLVRVPQAFTRPIKELTDGIIEISNHNYDQRLTFGSGSEFGEVADSFNKMAQQLDMFRKSSLANIMAAKHYLETIINSIEEPIIGINKEHMVLFANEAAKGILNLKDEEVVNKSALDIALHNDLFRRLVRGIDQQQVAKEEPLKIYSNNKESYFQVRYTPILDELQQMSGMVVILANITEFKELDNAKTNFISTISHELKTPISAIMMSLKLLEDQRVGQMNDEQHALAQSIKESSDRLLSITGELLKMTQVETGKLQLSPKVTKPIELINYAVNATKVLADKFGCNIEVEYPEKISKLFIDSEKIAWVITNLLANAIHYSKENARIIIGARQEDKLIEIYVQDFGRGIDPRYHNSIFERYFRVPGTKIQGSGLGLAISKDFVEAHGGKIRIESAVEQGSRFIVTLNIA